MGVECPKCKTENTSGSEFCKKCATSLPSSKDISAYPTTGLKTFAEELTRGSTFSDRYEISKSLVKAGCVGKIYEEKGWKAKAIEHYEKFLHLWKDADLGIPEVEDAKKRLAGLKSQRP